MLEDGKWIGPILDQHMHLDRSNRFLDAVSEFVRAGGTGIMFCLLYTSDAADE